MLPGKILFQIDGINSENEFDQRVHFWREIQKIFERRFSRFDSKKVTSIKSVQKKKKKETNRRARKHNKTVAETLAIAFNIYFKTKRQFIRSWLSTR